MKDQIAGVQAFMTKELKKAKIPENRIFKEQASGGKADRAEWLEVIAWAAAQPSKRAILVLDFSRWSRDPYYGYARAIPLREGDCPIVSILDGLATGTRTNPRPDADMIFGIKMIVGQQKIVETSRRVRKKVAQIQETRVSGSYLPLYADGTLSDPYNALNEVYPAYAADNLSKSALAREVLRLMGDPKDEPSESGIRNRMLDRYEAMKKKVDADTFKEWLGFLSVLYQFEKDNGDWIKERIVKGQRKGFAKKKKRNPRYSRGVDAVRRMTSLYVQKPDEYEMPTAEMIAEYFGNPNKYLES